MPEDKQKRNARMNRWKKENKERMEILFNKGTKDRVKAAADYVGESTSEYVRAALEQRLSETESEMGKG
jgi:predicted DNA-binding protein